MPFILSVFSVYKWMHSLVSGGQKHLSSHILYVEPLEVLIHSFGAIFLPLTKTNIASY